MGSTAIGREAIRRQKRKKPSLERLGFGAVDGTRFLADEEAA
jgi:hypothetical protein